MYKIGTRKEFEALQAELEASLLPYTITPDDTEAVLKEIEKNVKILDSFYGEERDYTSEGGYVAIFTDITQDDNEELLGLLAQYDQDVNCMEIERTIATVVAAQGTIDWCLEIYLIGTEYGVAVIRPRIPDMFDRKTPKYLSRDVAEYIPMLFHEFLYGSIEKMRENVKTLDYLQVLELFLERNKEQLTLVVRHKQEQPEMVHELFWVIPDTEEILQHKDKWDGKKLYMIDDGTAIVTLYPYER